jgi:integrative and conjugative element protein (TIGR02256 family)
VFPLQPDVDAAGTAWISKRVLASLTQIASAAAPLETGGILLGYWSESATAPVITGNIGPGPRAKHEQSRFVPDHDYQESEVAKLYYESNCTLQYLGDWHSHPGNAGYMSSTDFDTLRRIAVSRKARAPRPLMLILAYGPRWEPVVWSLQRKTRFGIVRGFAVERWQVAPFAEGATSQARAK